MDGQIQIMLITTRDTGRWIVPKGWPIRGLMPRQVAAREAREEAGVSGTVVGKKPIAKYTYSKRIEDEGSLDCEVSVFLLRVNRQKKTWKEQGQRKLGWFAPVEASALLTEPALSAVVLKIPNLLKAKRRNMARSL
ncbi:MAG: NUDIX hydrolase [Candidatus Sulfotelmatobacter sp.]